MLLPFLQLKFNLFKLEPLKGAITEPEPMEFSVKKWFSGEFQAEKDTIYSQTFGLRSVFIRANNQIDYSLFSKIHANGVIFGKENYLYEENYIKAYYGTDCIGKQKVDEQLKKLKFVQDELEKQGKTLLVVFAPGKGHFFPEYIPDRFHTKRKTTNYTLYTAAARRLKINHIDFNAWFMQNKKKSKAPLYGQYGIHWSKYGFTLATDSILKRIDQAQAGKNGFMTIGKTSWGYPDEGDQDILAAMNLLYAYPTYDMAYPEVKFEKGKKPLSIVTIADSFYWGPYGIGMFYAYDPCDFWYYNKEVYPQQSGRPAMTDQLDLGAEIKNHDVFMIMCTDANLPNFGWGVVEQLYDHLSKQ